ncbi:DUF3078 domain-containing protein [Olivibacter sp. SDN3]|uniref:DUF3078 domain-containing protein n=1 Tax=Olivibacter sp. SDN3 TaxID=2764720 RepID=UPI001651370D|nr:DUF3078 domain-containing protein [Olivibacter sp. SDN3]QNL50718.1 DUF3078 domain-containing protein [Olivibacter sp. SDN3]
MKKSYLIILFFFIVAALDLRAQDYNLDELRQAPEKNSLPVRTPQMSIHDLDIQGPDLNLKINYWRNWTTFSINANQATFSDNFNNGGVNSISLGSMFNTKWDYTRDNKTFISEMDLRYGVVQNENQLSRKSQDRIWWDNKFSLKFAPKWGFFAALTFETQFDVGWRYENRAGVDTRVQRISNFMAPGYLTQSLGLEYKPDQFSSIRFGTGTARQTFVLDDEVLLPESPLDLPPEARFGVPFPGTFRNELAFQILATTDRDLSSMLHLKAQYEFFANYEEFRNARHRLDAILTARVSRVISVMFNATLLYDPLQIPDQTFANTLQRSQLIGIGISYKFPR